MGAAFLLPRPRRNTGRTVRAACLLALLFAVALPQRAQVSLKPAPAVYRDPKARFTLRIPPGWNFAQMNDDAVQFSNGAAYVTMLSLPGTDPQLMLNSIGAATEKQWRNFTEARRGGANFGGRSGQYVTYSGINPMGSDAFLQMLAATDGSLTYLLMTSAPKADFTRLKSAFDQIEQSFTLTVSAVSSPPSLAPAPAGAVGTAPAQPPAAGSRQTPPPGTAARAAPQTQGAGAIQPRQGAGGASLAAPSPNAGAALRMRLARIVDERGFERPMTALTLLIPADWQFQGMVRYGQGTGCHANLVHLVFRAASPDGSLAVELFPGNTWQWTDDANMRNMLQASNQQMARFGAHGCDILPPMTAAEFLRRNVLPAVRPGAHAGESEAMPEAGARLEEEARAAEQAAARQGVRVNLRTDAARVRVASVQGGQPSEEWFTAMTTSVGMAGPTYNVRSGRMGQALYYSIAADHVFATRAPQGQLDARERLFRLILGTVRVDPQWEARVRQVIANLQAQDSKGAMDRSAIATQAGQDMSKMIHDSYQNATTSREHSMESWSQYMRGVQTFRNPNTGDTVELSNEYGHAWAGPDNTYLLTDSGSFNPNSSLNGNWTQLEQVRR